MCDMGGMPPAELSATLELAGHEVLPHFHWPSARDRSGTIAVAAGAARPAAHAAAEPACPRSERGSAPTYSAAMAGPCPIVLVHGAFHGAWCWAPLQAELDRLGIPSYAIDLPGHGASTAPLENLHGDAAAVEALLDGWRRDIDEDVVLVGHSYGGAVIGQAGLAGRVRRLVFLAALVAGGGRVLHEVVMRLPAEDSGSGRVMRRDEDGVMVPLPEAAGGRLLQHLRPGAGRRRHRPPLPPACGQPEAAGHRGGVAEPSHTYIRCAAGSGHSRRPCRTLMAARCGADVLPTGHRPLAVLLGAGRAGGPARPPRRADPRLTDRC